MNRKKIKYFGLILMLLAFVISIPSAYAVGGNSDHDNTTDFDDCSGGKCSSWFNSSNEQGIMITAYAYNGTGSPVRISRSQIYVNNINDYNMEKELNNNYHYRVAGDTGVDKLSYGSANFTKIKGGVKSLSFPDIYNTDDFKTWFENNVIIPEESNILTKINKDIGLDEAKLNSMRVTGYYYEVEPMLMVYTSKGSFFTTAYQMNKNSHLAGQSNLTSVSRNMLPLAMYVSTNFAIDDYNFIGDIISPINPSTERDSRNRKISNDNFRAAQGDITGRRGFGLGLYWKNRNFTCDINFDSHFPSNGEYGVYNVVIIDNKGTVEIDYDGTKANSVNCCQIVLENEFNGDYDKLIEERPECAVPTCPPEEKAGDLICNSNGFYASIETGTKYDWTEACIKSLTNTNKYTLTKVGEYARIVCSETVNTIMPHGLKEAQSIGTYFSWPTSTQNKNNNYQLGFTGTMYCMLALENTKIKNTGNAEAIYNDIYNKTLNYINSGQIASYYNMNCTTSKSCQTSITLTYDDVEYKNKNNPVYLVQDGEVETNIEIINQPSGTTYNRIKGLRFSIEKTLYYKLPTDAYKKITYSKYGNNSLNNMFDEINKNQFVMPKFDYGIIPISYKEKVSDRNITINYKNIGQNGRWETQGKDYTCPYELTYAPPTNTDDNDDGEDTYDDNNDSYIETSVCECTSGKYKGMDLKGYRIKNPKMTCEQARELYCDAARGNMNVEYRVISLKEPFPGSGETATTMEMGGRDIGYNWRDAVAQTKSGSVVKTFITNNRRVQDYQVYNLEPLYVIELDSAKIKAIREYNKTTTYADFNLNCVNDIDGTICTSPFLDQYVTSGTCQNASTLDKFYKCADKDIPESEK